MAPFAEWLKRKIERAEQTREDGPSGEVRRPVRKDFKQHQKRSGGSSISNGQRLSFGCFFTSTLSLCESESFYCAVADAFERNTELAVAVAHCPRPCASASYAGLGWYISSKISAAPKPGKNEGTQECASVNPHI